ncbi:MAG: hypothetical protein NZ901_08325 [Geminocystis sp.]|nr:hypothetical protein [Geminocystis sp.]HIK36535.1 hypothetical protein [Geminocystis sp. M7585_C2015_104]MCS7148179.1 hypothetical protein [Geminocystis sp.]MCX8077592.1 hypothetical protein [Geminocystis sp.]MDW8117258.1 hypothetical protein [Geminocystis sp.]
MDCLTFLPQLTAVAGQFPTYFVLVYVIGFIAAVGIGLVAFFGSKLPVGWEDVKKPDFIPDFNPADKSKDSSNTPKSSS